MSALIRVVASSQSAQLRPGEWADLTLTVQNFGETVDRYAITVEGIPASWVTISRTELSLFPKDRDQVRINLHPPAGPGTRAGSYPVRIHATSQENPSERSSVDFNLEVAALPAIEMALSPQRQSGTGEGVFGLQVANQGNADLTILFEAMDPEGSCFYSFEPPQATVPAGQTAQVRLRVIPTAPLPSKEPRVYPFTVTARPAEVPTQTRQVQGEWQQRPRRQLLLPILAAVLVTLLGAAAALFFLVVQPRLQAKPTSGPVAMAATETPTVPTGKPTPLPTGQPSAVPTARPTPPPTGVPTPLPTPVPTVPPTPEPTPDLRPQIEAALWEYTWIRAEAEKALKPEMLKQVCVDPYLSIKVERIEQNILDGTRWETWKVDWSIKSLTQLGEDRVEVWVTKTETKVFFPKGSAVPDDEVCTGAIYSYRDCTYDARYLMVRKEGRWYVSEAESVGDCISKCQH